MAVFDIDGSNTIELPEFLSFVKSQYREACGRIVDMTQTPGYFPLSFCCEYNVICLQ